MKKTMTLTVNDFPVYINDILIQKAKKSKISKNEYLTNLLKTHSLADEINEIKNSYEEIVKLALANIEKNTKVMEELVQIIEG